jgi:hypothetical protein
LTAGTGPEFGTPVGWLDGIGPEFDGPIGLGERAPETAGPGGLANWPTVELFTGVSRRPGGITCCPVGGFDGKDDAKAADNGETG